MFGSPSKSIQHQREVGDPCAGSGSRVRLEELHHGLRCLGIVEFFVELPQVQSRVRLVTRGARGRGEDVGVEILRSSVAKKRSRRARIVRRWHCSRVRVVQRRDSTRLGEFAAHRAHDFPSLHRRIHSACRLSRAATEQW